MAQTDLIEDHGWYRQLFLLSPDPAWIIDGNCFVECNTAAIDALGYANREEFLNIHPSKISPAIQADGEDSFTKAERIFALLKERGVYRFEWTHTKADGTDFEVEVTLSNIAICGRELIYCVWRDITLRKQQEIAIKEADERLATLMQSMKHRQFMMERTESLAHLASFEWEVDTNIVSWSPEMFRIFGRDPALGIPNLEGQAKLYTPESTEKLFAAVGKAVSDGIAYEIELITMQPNGEQRPCFVMGFPEFNENGRVVRLAGLVQDITARKEAERELRIAATAFDSQEGMTVTDVEGTILKVNNAFTKITGYSSAEAVGRNPRFLKSGRQSKEFYLQMWAKIISTGAWEGEIWNRRKNGEVYPEYLTITVVKDADGVVANYVATFNDITLSKASADEIKNLAFYDPLTKLPNRRLMLDRLRNFLATITRSGHDGALLFLDLDNFKNLNDTLGHDVGDLLLQQVAERLTSCVREGDTVARLGGDEFVVMLTDLSNKDIDAANQAEIIANKIMAVLNQSYQLDLHSYQSTPSIGISLIQGNALSAEEILKQADIAMYQSKRAGRNTVRFFDPKMQESIKEHMQLESDLCCALEAKQFQFYCQVQSDDLNRAVGVEALIRWQHPERGLLPPETFISHAEESGLVFQIGDWVLESACQLLKAWEHDVLTRELILSINVSAKQFHQTDFVSHIKSSIEQHGIKPSRLKLELTESLLLKDVEVAISKMQELKTLGVRLALDDFGTGYSSLQYLKRLPMEQLKIDKSFIRNIETDKDDRAIIKTIIEMAKNLNIEVIAEGVETEAQKQYLIENGCKQFQGFLFGEPVTVEQFELSLKSQ